MRTHKKVLKGIKVTAYNDSNCDWVVNAGNFSTQRFDRRKWTMRDAMEAAVDLELISIRLTTQSSGA